MSTNLGRQLRLEKIYSRARHRADLLRSVEDDFDDGRDDEFKFPLSSIRVDEEQRQSLASLMSADGDGAITFEPAPGDSAEASAETS